MAAYSLLIPPFLCAVPAVFAADPAVSSKAPAWELTDIDGKPVRSSDFDGKVVILDFWTPWCPPCKAEIPGFIELQKLMVRKPDYGVCALSTRQSKHP